MLEIVRQNPLGYIGGTLQTINQELGLTDVSEYRGSITGFNEDTRYLWVRLANVIKRSFNFQSGMFGEWREYRPNESYPIDLHAPNSDAIHLGGGVYRFRADNEGHAAYGTFYPPNVAVVEPDTNNLLSL